MSRKDRYREPMILDGIRHYDATSARIKFADIMRAAAGGTLSAVRIPGGAHVLLMPLQQYRRMIAVAGRSPREVIADDYNSAEPIADTMSEDEPRDTITSEGNAHSQAPMPAAFEQSDDGYFDEETGEFVLFEAE